MGECIGAIVINLTNLILLHMFYAETAPQTDFFSGARPYRLKAIS